MQMKPIGLIMIALVSVGCSYRGAYEGIQAGKRQECTKVPSSEYEECLRNANKSYDEYLREREEVLKR